MAPKFHIDLARWKECYLPPKPISNGSYLSCEIYAPKLEDGDDDNTAFWNQTEFNECPWNNDDEKTVSERKNQTCKRGWTFDRSEFSRTIATDYDWVCDNSQRVPEQFMLSQVCAYSGDSFGTFLLLILPVFYPHIIC